MAGPVVPAGINSFATQPSCAAPSRVVSRPAKANNAAATGAVDTVDFAGQPPAVMRQANASISPPVHPTALRKTVATTDAAEAVVSALGGRPVRQTKCA